MRRMLYLVFLLFPTQFLAAQTVEDRLQSMQAQIERLQHELTQLKQELSSQKEAVEDVPLVQAQVAEQAQTKVETSSKFPLKLYGAIVSNTFYNTGIPNWLDIPNIAQGRIQGVHSGSFSSTLRQTRLGAVFEGPAVAGMRLNGNVSFDFVGGFSTSPTAEVMGLPRLLYAYVRLDGEKTAFEIGQDHMILAPKNPTSLVGMSYPSFYRSGNLYLRVPQIRAERLLASGPFGEVRAVGGIVAPIAGDNPEAAGFQFDYPNLAGEQSNSPAVQGRLSWRATPAGPYEQPKWEFGFSSHFGHERFTTGIVPSWATAADFDATSGKFGLGGEYFVGRNLAGFGGGIGQNAKSQGGWIEARFAATRRLSFNGGYGTDQMFDLARFPVPLSRNGTFFGNTIYSFTPEFRGGVEYQRLATKPVANSVNTNDHINLTFAYSF